MFQTVNYRITSLTLLTVLSFSSAYRFSGLQLGGFQRNFPIIFYISLLHYNAVIWRRSLFAFASDSHFFSTASEETLDYQSQIAKIEKNIKEVKRKK
jgi:hypothetical protein